MSLPLPVFRLDTRSDLPFEPLCAIAPCEVAEGAVPGIISRLQQWLAHPRAALSDDVEGS